MNLLKQELKFNRKSFLIWSIVTGLLYFITLVVYPSLINSQDISAMLEMFPEELLQAFNMDLTNISTGSGWLSSEGLILYLLAGGIYAGILGSTIVLKEESERTIEFLYARPISKKQILVSKIVCALIYIVAFTFIVTLTSILALSINDDLVFGKMALLLFSPVMIFISFFFITLLISTFLRKTKSAVVISFALVFFSYFLQVISTISDKVKFLKYFSPFTFSDSRYILQNSSISAWSIVIFIATIAVSVSLSSFVYNKKEYL